MEIKTSIAALVVGTVALVGSEMADAKTINLADWNSPDHTHVETPEALRGTMAVPFFASGAAALPESYQVQLAAEMTPESKIAGYKAIAFDGSYQRMYAHFDTLKAVAVFLRRQLNLPAMQARAIFDQLAAGRGTIIGGSRSGVHRIFDTRTLFDAGLTFRPLA